ncbi:hypothetical protein WUBG_04235, partial [Wuchereria bancrofti]
MNLFYYSVLLTLIYKPCTSFLNFPSDNIRRLRILDVIGGYPKLFSSDVSSAFNILLAEMLLYVFGIANSSGDVIAICKYPAFPTFTTAGQLTQLNDPNCTIKQQT